jgi:uncharacterized protein YbaA (DUF1428 family)
VETRDGWKGEVLWTTLNLVDQPLVKFASADVVEFAREPCPCGDTSPLMTSVRRRHDEIVIFGHKIPYDLLLGSLEKKFGHLEFLQVLTDESPAGHVIRCVVPESLKKTGTRCREIVLGTDEIGDFERRGLISVDVLFARRPLVGGRKPPRVVRGARKLMEASETCAGVGPQLHEGEK